MQHYAAFFLSLYSVCSLWVKNFKYPCSQLLVLYRLFWNQLLNSFWLFFKYFSYTEHKEPSSAAVSFSNLCEENNNARSAGEKPYRSASSIADNRTRGTDTGGFGAPTGPSVSQVLLQLSGSPPVGVCISHFTETPATSAGHLTEMRSDTFFPFFTTWRTIILLNVVITKNDTLFFSLLEKMS